jgi:VanZ family protein
MEFLVTDTDRASSLAATRRSGQVEEKREPMAEGPAALGEGNKDDARAAGSESATGVSFTTIARLVAWACLLAIAILSLVPGILRPHTFLPGRTEHFMAYAGTGFFFVLGYLDFRQRIVAWVGLAIASGVFEMLQAFIPGRSASILDALASTGGLTFGLTVGLIAEAVLSRRTRRARARGEATIPSQRLS